MMINFKKSIFLFCCILLVGCSDNSSTSENTKDKYPLYINYINSSHQFVYKFTEETDKTIQLFNKKLEEYPTSAFSEKKQNIYFTSNVNKTTQLFKKNMHSNKTIQLTKGLAYVDFLSLDDSKQILYMRILENITDRNFKLAILNLKNSEYKIIKQNKELSVVNFDYNPNTEDLLVVTKSTKEEFESLEKANKDNAAPIPPKHYINLYSNDGTFKKELRVLKKFVRSAVLSANSKKMLINFKDGLEFKQPSKIIEYNMDGSYSKIMIEENKEYTNIGNPRYSKDKNGFYFIAEKIQGNENNNKVAINYFDFNSRKVKQIWYQSDGQPVSFYN